MTKDSTQALRVILINFRSLEDLRRLFASSALVGHEVTVVDNGDDPSGVTQLCADYGAQPVLLPDNVGFARAINHVVSLVAQPDLPWLLLNPDVCLTSKDLAEMREQLMSAQLDGVAPLLVMPSGKLQVGIGGAELTLRSVATYFLLLAHVMPWLRGIFFTRRQSRRAGTAAWLCMACMMLSPDAFARYGPIPEDELVYAEDIAWGTQATAKGAHLRLLPSVTVGHAVGGSGGSAAWNGALERLCRRRLGRVRGPLAVAAIRTGLRVRSTVQRVLPGR